MTMEHHTACFVIEGPALVKIARDLFLSERPDQAWRTIAQGLVGGEPGQTEHLAREILDGKKTLSGDSNVGIEIEDDDDAEEYLQEARYIYAGRVRIDGTWWRPIAEVTQLGTADANHASRQGHDGSLLHRGNRVAFTRARMGFYAGRTERVVEVQNYREKRAGIEVEDFVIFESVSEPPFWWAPHITPTDAVKDFLAAGRYLEKRKCPKEPPAPARPARFPTGLTEENRRELAREHEEEDARDKKRASEWKAKLKGYGEEVRKRAGTDTFELVVSDGRKLTVARAPFWHWALGRTSLRHLAPPWVPVSPNGVKLPLDNEWHTDWMLGAGVSLDESYGGPVAAAATDAMFKLQEELGDYEAGVIVDGGGATGIVGKEILVLSDLGPEHASAALRATAIVTELGGQLAHLALVGRERGQTIMLVPDARTRYPEGAHLTLDPAEGKIHHHFDRR